MSYDVVIEQVKALPEQLLTSVSSFYGATIETRQHFFYCQR